MSDESPPSALAEGLLKAAASYLQAGQPVPSFRKLASGLGVTHPAIYRHFASREALMAEVAKRSFTQLGKRITSQIQATDAPRDRLTKMAEEFFDYFLANPGFLDLMFGPLYEELRDNYGIDQKADPVFDQVRLCCETLDIPQNTSEKLAVQLWSQAFGFISLYLSKRLRRHVDNKDDAKNMLRSAILALIKSHSSRGDGLAPLS